MKRKRPFPNDIEEPQVPGWRRGPAAGLGGKDWGPPGSVTSGPRRRSAKLCTVSSGSLPRGAISSLSPAQNSGLEKGAAGRSSPLHGGGNREEGPRHSPLVRPLSLGRAGRLEPRGRGRVRLGQRGLRGAGGRRGGRLDLKPEGSACRAPPTYRNRFRAAGWSPRTGSTSESRPSSDACSPHVLGQRRS